MVETSFTTVPGLQKYIVVQFSVGMINAYNNMDFVVSVLAGFEPASLNEWSQ